MRSAGTHRLHRRVAIAGRGAQEARRPRLAGRAKARRLRRAWLEHACPHEPAWVNSVYTRCWHGQERSSAGSRTPPARWIAETLGGLCHGENQMRTWMRRLNVAEMQVQGAASALSACQCTKPWTVCKPWPRPGQICAKMAHLAAAAAGQTWAALASAGGLRARPDDRMSRPRLPAEAQPRGGQQLPAAAAPPEDPALAAQTLALRPQAAAAQTRLRRPAAAAAQTLTQTLPAAAPQTRRRTAARSEAPQLGGPQAAAALAAPVQTNPWEGRRPGVVPQGRPPWAARPGSFGVPGRHSPLVHQAAAHLPHPPARCSGRGRSAEASKSQAGIRDGQAPARTYLRTGLSTKLVR